MSEITKNHPNFSKVVEEDVENQALVKAFYASLPVREIHRIRFSIVDILNDLCYICAAGSEYFEETLKELKYHISRLEALHVKAKDAASRENRIPWAAGRKYKEVINDLHERQGDVEKIMLVEVGDEENK